MQPDVNAEVQEELVWKPGKVILDKITQDSISNLVAPNYWGPSYKSNDDYKIAVLDSGATSIFKNSRSTST